MSTPVDRLFAALDATVGATERPLGSNTDGGGHIDRCQWRYGMGRGTRTGAVPWCNCHAGDRVAAAGIDDHDVMSPATAVTADRARAKGFVIPHPIPGAHMVWYGKHIGTVRRVYTRTLVLGNEGNASDAVREVPRSTAGTILFALPAIRTGQSPPPAPVTLYGFEDPRGRMLQPGAWRSKTFAKNALRKLGPLGRGATLTKRNGRWRILLSARFRGYEKRTGRDAWMAKRQAAINVQRRANGLPPVTLRSYRYEVTVITNNQAQAQNLGRTI